MNIGKFIPKKVIYKRGDFEITTNELLDLGIELILFYLIYYYSIGDLLNCKIENVKLVSQYQQLFQIPLNASSTSVPSMDISKFNFSTQP